MRADTPFRRAGSKNHSVPKILRHIPDDLDLYHEPFVGAGAVYFALLRQRGAIQVNLSDIDPRLINCYRWMRDDPEGLITNLPLTRDREFFYQVTRWWRRYRGPRRVILRPETPSSSLVQAAYYLYVNRLCMHGRTESGGLFREDRYHRDRVVDLIRFFSPLMRNSTFDHRGERRHLYFPRRSFAFLDPPYPGHNLTGDYGMNSTASEVWAMIVALIDRLAGASVPFYLTCGDSPDLREVVGRHRLHSTLATIKNRKPKAGHRILIELHARTA
jgi:DNA adenine methylase